MLKKTETTREKRWLLHEEEEGFCASSVEEIVSALGISRVLARLLVCRGYRDAESARAFICMVNGYIMNNYTSLNYRNRISIMDQMRKEAFDRYARLHGVKGSLSDLPDEMKVDAIASLFVVIEQVFGRLCRLGSTMKEKYPTIYWVDGAFNATEESKFDTLKELENYLEDLMDHGPNPLVAKTLYEPFYKALKGECPNE